MNNVNYDKTVAVIGAGIMGLATAYYLAKKGYKVTVFEKENRIGRKLLATGNGKCNLSNEKSGGAFYSGSFAQCADTLLQKYNAQNIAGKFKRYGLYCTPDSEGRIYPYSRQASAVLDCMLIKLEGEKSVVVKCGEAVNRVKAENGDYAVVTDSGEYRSDYVIMAFGGMATPSLGSDGSGFGLLRSMGITVNKPFPSLCPVYVQGKRLKNLKGIRCKCAASLIGDGDMLKTEYGELQITENALSGICIFQLSRYINEFFALGTADGKKVAKILIDIDLFPDMAEGELFELLKWRRDNIEKITVEQYFIGLVNKRLGIAIYKESGFEVPLDSDAKTLDNDDLLNLAHCLKSWRFTPAGPSKWDNAQVTAGGISAHELDRNTLEIKKYPNVYCIGEAVDIDGICGGYNLHWAWTSALVCAGATVRSAKKRFNGGIANDKNT